MSNSFFKSIISSFFILYAFVSNASTYSWTGTSGKYLFDDITLSPGATDVSYTINTQAGTTFSLDGDLYSNRYKVNISIDGTIENTYSEDHWEYTHTFTSSGSHVITISKKSQWETLKLSNIIVSHPRNTSAVQSITLDEAGDLKYHLTDDIKYYIKKLSISGPINGEDMKIIRDLGSSILSELTILNLSGAQMKSGGDACGTYYYLVHGSYGDYGQETNIYTDDDVINGGLFYRLPNLTEVTLPESVTKIRKSAFDGCINEA